MNDSNIIVHSNWKQGTEKALDLINPATGEHIIPKYESFCQDYAHHFDPRMAMDAAGYPVEEKSVKQMRAAFGLVMKKRDVQMRIQSLIREKAERLGVGSDWVVMKWLELLDRCMQKESVKDNKGNPTGEWKFDARGANIVLENMAKYFGMFAKDNVTAKPVLINVNFGGDAAEKSVAVEGEVVSG